MSWREILVCQSTSPSILSASGSFSFLLSVWNVSKLPVWDLVALAPIYPCIPWHWLNEELVRWLKRLTSMQLRGKLWWWWSFPEFPEQKNPWISLKCLKIHPRRLSFLVFIKEHQSSKQMSFEYEVSCCVSGTENNARPLRHGLDINYKKSGTHR